MRLVDARARSWRDHRRRRGCRQSVAALTCGWLAVVCFVPSSRWVRERRPSLIG